MCVWGGDIQYLIVVVNISYYEFNSKMNYKFQLRKASTPRTNTVSVNAYSHDPLLCEVLVMP